MAISNELKLSDPDELLLRQVHPNMQQDGRPSSLAFRPNRGDEGLLSSDRHSLISPKDAFEAYLASGRLSFGTWGILVGEYNVVGLAAFSDPVTNNDAHAVVDFSDCSEKEARAYSKQLFKCATDRSMLYPEATGGVATIEALST